MGYKVSFEEANKIFAALQDEYEIWGTEKICRKRKIFRHRYDQV